MRCNYTTRLVVIPFLSLCKEIQTPCVVGVVVSCSGFQSFNNESRTNLWKQSCFYLWSDQFATRLLMLLLRAPLSAFHEWCIPQQKTMQFATAESNKLMRKKLCNLALAADLGHLRSAQHAGRVFMRPRCKLDHQRWLDLFHYPTDPHDNPAAEAVKPWARLIVRLIYWMCSWFFSAAHSAGII